MPGNNLVMRWPWGLNISICNVSQGLILGLRGIGVNTYEWLCLSKLTPFILPGTIQMIVISMSRKCGNVHDTHEERSRDPEQRERIR